MKTKTRLFFLCSGIGLSIILAVLVISKFSNVGDIRKPQNRLDSAKDVVSNKQENTTGLQNEYLNSPKPRDPLADKLDLFVCEEIKGEADIYLRLLSSLTRKDREMYSELLHKIKTSNNPDDFVVLADIVESIVERYWLKFDEKVFAYQLIRETLREMEDSQLCKEGNKKIEPQKARLLMWQYYLERTFNGTTKGIDPWQEDSAKSFYSHLQQLEPDTTLCKLEKQALLYKGQEYIFGSTTDIEPLKSILDLHPERVSARDQIVVNRTKTMAFLELARLFSVDGGGILVSGLYYQYAIDYIEALPRYAIKAMNDYDKQYFEEAAKQAAIGLAQVRSKCEISGLDLDRTLAQRLPVRQRYLH